jgi:hypothetical protein
MSRVVRAAVWIVLVALIVLGARAIAYALTPGPEAVILQHRAAGPTLPVVAGASLVLGLGISAVLVWLAWTAVRERHLLSGAGGPAPAFPLGRVSLTTPGLFLASAVAFTVLESSVHERAGMGVHGLSCLFGPVHRNAVPILAALALLAAVVEAAGRHVLAWLRRAARVLLRARVPQLQHASVQAARTLSTCLPSPNTSPFGARAPPAARPA